MHPPMFAAHGTSAEDKADEEEEVEPEAADVDPRPRLAVSPQMQ